MASPALMMNGHQPKPKETMSPTNSKKSQPQPQPKYTLPSLKPIKKTQEAKMPEIPAQELYAKLCQLYIEGSIIALRHFFDSIHPPATLNERLAKPELHKPLRRLRAQGLITDEQWRVVFPINKRHVSSAHYDGVLLVILLKSVCRLSAPYPTGWDELPLEDDHSMAADLVRLELYRKAMLVLHDRQEEEDMDYKQFQVRYQIKVRFLVWFCVV